LGDFKFLGVRENDRGVVKVLPTVVGFGPTGMFAVVEPCKVFYGNDVVKL
jgi:hypothetical protein